MANLKLTKEEVQFLYEKIKSSKDVPQHILDKMNDIIYNLDDNVGRIEEKILDNFNFNNRDELKDIYSHVNKYFSKMSYTEFLNHIELNMIKIFTSTDSWYNNYLSRYDDQLEYKWDLDLLVTVEIESCDVGKTIMDKLLEKLLKYDTSLFTMHGKIIIANI